MGRVLGSAIVGGVCAAILAGGFPAIAATADGEHEVAPAALELLGESVSLITGDRVRLLEGADGETAVAFEAAPRDDGSRVDYVSFGDDGHFYVIPTDVAPLVPDQLDLALFDVLMLQELTDTEAGEGIPVIVQTAQEPEVAVRTGELAELGVETDLTLESISSVAGETDASGAPELVEAVEETGAVEKVWLDTPMRALDSDSAPQIGAPTAWDGGFVGTGATVAVLDTGIDTSHPDLDEGIVTLERDFTPSGHTGDNYGHGTHVASIVAGTGELSGGTNRGIAPGAHLINAKVLNDVGYGADSWIIAGMEWAAANGADIINMSLGDPGVYTDGTDPTSLAVNRLSEQYDTLFVISAGNEGKGGTATTVSTPGTADSALTVGAVNDSDNLTSFSSIGPRFGDWAIKPDIVAPGDGIIAARAKNSTIGTWLDDYYMAESGTSMAAPAVAGAAAILQAAEPELSAQAIKSVLMGSANPTPNHVFAQGSGRVWIPGALAAAAYATPASLSFGMFGSPRGTQAPKTKTVTYTNTTDTDLELHFQTTVAQSDHTEIKEGLISLSADSVIVPANGTASVDVTVDPHADDPDVYQGELLASGPGFQPIRTVLAFGSEPDMFTLRFEGTQQNGLPAVGPSHLVLHGLDDTRYYKWVNFEDGVASVRVPLGRYAVLGELFTAAGPGAPFVDQAVFTTDLDVSADQEIVLDARDGIPLEVETDKKTTPAALEVSLTRRLPEYDYPIGISVGGSVGGPVAGIDDGLSVLPADDLLGQTTVAARAIMNAPLLDAKVVAAKTKLDVATDLAYGLKSPKVQGALTAPLVDAGTGTPEELSAAGVAGAVALVEFTPNEIIEAPPRPRDESQAYVLNTQAQAAFDAGAVAVIVYGADSGPFFENVSDDAFGTMFPKPLPTLTATRDVGLELVALAHRGGRLEGEGTEAPSYQYALAYLEEGGIPGELEYEATSRNTAKVHVDVQALALDLPMVEYIASIIGSSYTGTPLYYEAPFERDVYYSTDDGVAFQRFVGPVQGGTTGWASAFESAVVSYRPGQQVSETWFGAVTHSGFDPAPARPEASSVWRDGDTLNVNLPYRVDGDGNAQQSGPDYETTARFQLWVDAETLVDGEYASASEAVPGDERTYRMRLDSHRDVWWWPTATNVSTEWGFRSTSTDGPAILPLLQLDYGVSGLNDFNTGGRTTKLNLEVSHQDGSTGGGEVSGLKLWSSVDAGATWTPARVEKASGSGAYRATVTAPKGATSVSLRSEAWDSAGASFTETVIDAYAVDTVAPTVEVTAPAAGPTVPTNSPAISGTGEPGAKVTVESGRASCEATVGADGSWTCELPVRDGKHVVTVTAVDAVGNMSAAVTRTIVVDTKVPSAPKISSPKGTERSAVHVIEGSAEAGAMITVAEGANPVCTTTASGSGKWSCQSVAPFNDGTHTITVTATDQAGNTSAVRTHLFTVAKGR